MPYRESHFRTAAKTVSWRLTATLTTVVLVWAFSGEIALALEVGAVELFAKIIIFYGHERLWELFTWGRSERRPAKVIWLTGLSGSGKSTVGEALVEELRGKGLQVEYLDGDKIREIFPSTGFTKQDRDMHIKRVGHLCSILEKNGVTVVASFVSPYRETRGFVRGICKNFVEVYVSTPLDICEKRDVKGLYAKARRGEIKNFTGIDAPYEPPEQAELQLDTSTQSIPDSVKTALRTISM